VGAIDTPDRSGPASGEAQPDDRPPRAVAPPVVAPPAVAPPAVAPSVVELRIPARTIWTVIGAILLTLVAVQAVRAASSVLSLVALSFFFSLALDPVVQRLQRTRGWRRGTAVGAIYLAGLASLVAMVLFLVPAIGELAARVAQDADEWITQLNAWTRETFGFPLAEGAGPELAAAGRLTGQFAEGTFGTVIGVASSGVQAVFALATIAMFTFSFTAAAPRMKHAVLRLLAPSMQQRIGWTWDQAIAQTGAYFASRMVLMGINAAGFFAVMLLVGLPLTFAVPLAVFGGFVSVFIPAVGTYLGAAVPVLITLALRGVVAGLVVLGYAVVYQQIENYVLSPRISAGTMSLNGGVAFGAALAGGAIAGPVGAFVALPVAALISATISNYARSYEVVYRSPYDEEPAPPAEPGAAPAG
jgi:predicted PurR-regulated permease PerM